MSPINPPSVLVITSVMSVALIAKVIASGPNVIANVFGADALRTVDGGVSHLDIGAGEQ